MMEPDDGGELAAMFLLLVVLLVAFLWMVEPAKSHSWYDNDCCHDEDCAPVTKVELVPGGERMTTKHGTVFVPYDFKKVRPSQDEHVHVCMTKPVVHEFGDDTYPSQPICVYRPAGV